MGLDADTAEFLAALAAEAAPPLTEGSVEEARANHDSSPKAPADPIARVEDHVIPGPAGNIPVRLYADNPAPDLPIVVYFHGGGWVLSNIDGADPLPRRLARLTGALIVSVGYRLAPEHPYPAPHEDCWSATSWIAEHGGLWGGDPARLAVCGDSAGGNLAAGVALRARDTGLNLALQALIYPCIDPDQAPYPSMRTNATGYFLSAADMTWFWDHYLPPNMRCQPYAVPAQADELIGVAPAFIQTAEYDPLRDEAERYADRLAHAGVPSELIRYPGVVHGFVARWQDMKRGERAQADLAAALRRALDMPL